MKIALVMRGGAASTAERRCGGEMEEQCEVRRRSGATRCNGSSEELGEGRSGGKA